MTDNELLLAISNMVDKKLKPVNDRLTKIELTQETMSNMMDKKLKPVNDRLTKIELTQETMSNMMDDRLTKIEFTQETKILPRLKEIESCYISTFNRYQSGVTQIDQLQFDMDIVKNVVTEHSEKLQKIS